MCNPGIVDQDVEPSGSARTIRFERRASRLRASETSHAADSAEPPAAVIAEPPLRRRRARPDRAPPRGPPGGRTSENGASDAGTAAGDDGDLPAQVEQRVQHPGASPGQAVARKAWKYYTLQVKSTNSVYFIGKVTRTSACECLPCLHSAVPEARCVQRTGKWLQSEAPAGHL